MIVHETYAVCEGCGERVAGNLYPLTWPRVKTGELEQAFCSATCILQKLSGTLLPKRTVWPRGLKDQDVRILELVSVGKSNKEVARALNLAESTVKNNLSVVNAKLGTEDRLQSVLRAHAVGILNLNTLAQRFAEGRSEVERRLEAESAAA